MTKAAHKVGAKVVVHPAKWPNFGPKQPFFAKNGPKSLFKCPNEGKQMVDAIRSLLCLCQPPKNPRTTQQPPLLPEEVKQRAPMENLLYVRHR